MGWLRVKRWHAADTIKNVFAAIDDVVHQLNGHDHSPQDRRGRDARVVDNVEGFAATLRRRRVARKHQFADVEGISASLERADVGAVPSARSPKAMQKFRQQLDGDIALLARQADWDAAIGRFLHYGKGSDDAIETGLSSLVACLCEQIALAEPSAAPHSIAVLVRERPRANDDAGPARTETLRVHHASEASELEAGAALQLASQADLDGASAATPPTVAAAATVASDCRSALSSGEAILRNRHGISGAGARSVVPLKVTRLPSSKRRKHSEKAQSHKIVENVYSGFEVFHRISRVQGDRRSAVVPGQRRTLTR